MSECYGNNDETCTAKVEVSPNVSTIIFSGLVIAFVWFSIKMSIRMIRAIVKPVIYITAFLVVLYTKQFSKSENLADFVVNVVENAIMLITYILGIVGKIINALLDTQT